MSHPLPDYQCFDLSGPHYALGHAQGAATERFITPAWWPPPPPLEFALDCARQIAELHPPLLDELRGYADSQALPYADLLRGVCRRSMRLRARPTPPAPLPEREGGAAISAPLATLTSEREGRAAISAPQAALTMERGASSRDSHQPYPEGGCSSFAVAGADGHVRVGRNYDFHTVQRVRQRLRLCPERGRPSVGTRGSVPGGRYDGVNDAGLFICLHVALSDEPAEARAGVPFHLLPRLVLETCATTREAVDLLLRVRHLHPFNYLIADKGGDLAVVEAHPEAARVVERGGGFMAASNHYRHPDLRRYQRGRKLTHSEGRLNYLYAQRQRLRVGGGEAVAEALQDHASGLCGHAGGHTTLWSLTADLTARRVAYAQGAPCETRYAEVAWPGGSSPAQGEPAA